MLTEPVTIDHYFPARDRYEAGRAQRKTVPRAAHALWSAPAGRVDPVAALDAHLTEDIPSLVPLRHGRMSVSPATFLRGAAGIMAADLAGTPNSGLWVQASGDCHLHNFGTFATPEGTPVFDVNDFDETLPAPFEWDVKRLAASFVVEARARGLSPGTGRTLARAAVTAYRTRMRASMDQAPLDLWHARTGVMDVVNAIQDPRTREREARRIVSGARTAQEGYPRLVERNGEKWRIVPKAPTIFPLTDQADAPYESLARGAFDTWRAGLPEERRHVLDRYRMVDMAFKAVGVGSVGTFCAIGLLVTAEGMPLLLQLKEARVSVLAPYARASVYENQGQRVVVGQRIIQAEADPFLGWTVPAAGGRHFYVRHLKDARLARLADALVESSLPHHATLCGTTLAHAHARSGDAAALSGYMGAGEVFDTAIADFAVAYAARTRADWKRLRAAIEAGEIKAIAG